MDKRFPFYKKVLKNKANGQLYVIIDKKQNVVENEYVKIEVQE